tara:strand:+ start:38550 stop:38936 length:387 start_codon:yes stop_codon:yes gene_type:complete
LLRDVIRQGFVTLIDQHHGLIVKGSGHKREAVTLRRDIDIIPGQGQVHGHQILRQVVIAQPMHRSRITDIVTLVFHQRQPSRGVVIFDITVIQDFIGLGYPRAQQAPPQHIEHFQVGIMGQRGNFTGR